MRGMNIFNSQLFFFLSFFGSYLVSWYLMVASFFLSLETLKRNLYKALSHFRNSSSITFHLGGTLRKLSILLFALCL